jgi:hypothetical protein
MTNGRMTNGYQPKWDLDLKLGEAAQRYVLQRFIWLCDGDGHIHVEVKHKRRSDDWLYVEQEHRPPGATEYRPSGISASEAELWAYSIGDTGAVIFVPTFALRSAIAAGYGRPVEETDGDCPTRGRLLRIATILNQAHMIAEATQ